MILGIIIGVIAGMLLTSVVVILDWDEHPKRTRSRWLKHDNLYTCMDCWCETERETRYCPECGAVMGGVIEHECTHCRD